MFDLVVVGDVVADILRIDRGRWSLASIGSEPFGKVESAVVNGCRFAAREFVLLNNPDTTFLIPEVDSLEFKVGRFCIGVFGVSATGVPLSVPAADGGVGEVFRTSGGFVCKAPYAAGVVPFILSWKVVGGWCESVGVRGSFAASLLVSSSSSSSSSSSGIGLVISTGRDSGDEA